MKVQVNDAANSQKEMDFELPYEAFEKAAETELLKMIPEVKIPGFRPGKAPKDVVQKQYAHKIQAQAIEHLINDALKEGMTANNINPLSQPNVSDVKFEENKPITFKARMDVFPEIKLEKYKGFEVEKSKITIEDKDIEEALKGLQEKFSSFEPVKTRKTAKKDDMVVIDFIGKLDGAPFQGGSANDFSLGLGSGQFIPGFEDGVEGMKIDETKDIELKFPEDYGQKDLAGKVTVFTVTLKEIKEKVMPKLDDELAKDVNEKFENLQQLKDNIRKSMEAEYENASRYESFNAILNQILNENKFDVPYAFVKEQSERLAYNSMNQFYQMGVNPEQMGINFEMMVQRHIPQAQIQVKQALIINELARKENISVEDADLDKFIELHAELQNKTAEGLKSEIEKANQMDALRNDVLGDKVFDYLASVNTVKVKETTKTAYEKEKQEKTPMNEKTETKKSSKAKKDTEDKGEKIEKKVSHKKEATHKEETHAAKTKTAKKTTDKGDK